MGVAATLPELSEWTLTKSKKILIKWGIILENIDSFLVAMMVSP